MPEFLLTCASKPVQCELSNDLSDDETADRKRCVLQKPHCSLSTQFSVSQTTRGSALPNDFTSSEVLQFIFPFLDPFEQRDFSCEHFKGF